MSIKYETFEICTKASLPTNADNLWIHSSNPSFSKMKSIFMTAIQAFLGSPDNPVGAKNRRRNILNLNNSESIKGLGTCNEEFAVYVDIGSYLASAVSGSLYVG